MHAPAYQRPLHARYNKFHGPKQAVIGHPARQVPPAWRANAVPPPPGSKIFISRLPVDVGEQEIEELFTKTVGPLREFFLIYNNQGRSKGMAVVGFQRKGDAAVARAKYNMKIVDGRRPIVIEIISDEDAPAPAPAGPPSLFDRIGGVAKPQAGPASTAKGKKAAAKATGAQAAQKHAAQAAEKTPAVPPRRLRQKKGARRLQKRAAAPVPSKTREELDQEMEDYRASGST
ncbi:hypothetical protein BD626DRAFT_456967 [Schizophyllum amplum]|uniref:RRM domain-containing protein n=1 Tax=Schizophyllum amplum TaxID=97359 RepID=A0A550CFI5_9AGAR|nr:hypothetical protein BD626DRAFT_456967 [Auriculariopsis ampla]